MPSTNVLLTIYYAGFGFVALLGWTAIAQDLNEPFDDERRSRWNRASAVVATIGLAHPALPLVARDIARQAARTDDGERLPSRHVAFATVASVAAIVAAVGVLLAS